MNHGKRWLDHDVTTVVERWYRTAVGRFCRGTHILVNLNKSPEVREWFSES